MNIESLLINFDTRAVVALLALFVAIWSIYSGRKHNKLSVKPLLVDYISMQSAQFECGIYIANKGLGPALIKEVSYLIDGEPASFKDIKDIFRIQPTEFVFKRRWLQPGNVVSKGEIIGILEIQWDALKYSIPESRETQKIIAKDIKDFASSISKRIGIVIIYESIYGDTEKLSSLPSNQR